MSLHGVKEALLGDGKASGHKIEVKIPQQAMII